MLSALARTLTRLVAVLFTLLGAILFLAPGWAAPNFLWKISSFVAMTMGGWYLGSAVLAWESARVWRWSTVYPCSMFLWSFSLLEAGVLILHRSSLRLDAPLGWPYLGVIAAAALVALVGIADRMRTRPASTSGDPSVPMWLRAAVIGFTLFVGFLALMGSLGFGQGAAIFPEKLTLFTIHAFAAFYLALGIGALPLIWARGITPILAYGRMAYALIVLITLAALVYIKQFDFGSRPGQLLYIGAYLAVGVGTAVLLARYRNRARGLASEAR
jgi:hypothetical protein